MRRLVLWLIAIGTLVANGVGQIQPQREWLERFSSAALVTSQRERAHAESIAVAKGMPVRRVSEEGAMIELQRFDNNRPVYYLTHNLNAAKTISTDRVWAGGSGGYSLSGSTDTLAMWDGGPVLNTHQEFGSRVTVIDAGTAAGHATHVAGTMVASGAYASAKGMSPAARLRSYDWTNDLSEMASAAAAGLRVSNHSYGYITGWYYNYRGDNKWAWFGDTTISATTDYAFGFYSSSTQSIDDLAYNAPYYLIVRSAGNDRGEGPTTQPVSHWRLANNTWVLSSTVRSLDGGATGYDCIEGYALGKNVLAVGAVSDITTGYSQPSDVVMSSFSGWGPTDDGRIKPDIVANGVSLTSSYSTSTSTYAAMSGTSMASPNVSGSVGLLLQLRKTLWGAAPLRAATLKALIIHTADEAGSSNGPDYRFGWGLMNTLKAANLMKADSSAGGNFGIRELQLTQGGTIDVPVYCNGTEPLRATICWTDPAGTPPADALNPSTIMLVNDLDVRIIGNSTTYFPWVLDPTNPGNAATTGDNIRDNVEEVLLSSPVAGWYTVRVSHKGTLNGGSQAVSMITSGHIPPLFVNVKAFLQGAYDSSASAMKTTLRSAGYLPTHHPYAGAPWNYLGTDSVKTIPAGVVDWVLVQLRTGTDSISTVESRAAFIKSDGTVVDTNGTTPVRFSTAAAGSYYIVLRHRSHIAVMSANSVSLNSSSARYDFTAGTDKYYGGEAMLVKTGVYGLFAGDVTGDGAVVLASELTVVRANNLEERYDNADVNLDGAVVLATELTVIRANNLLETNVP